MAYIDELHDLCDFLADELKDTNKKLFDADKMTNSDLEYLDKLTHTIKSVRSVLVMEGYGDDDYSDRERSYTGGGHDEYARRERSRAAHKEGLEHELRKLMRMTNDPATKREIERLMDRM